jgi:hypothetical protein
MTAKVPKADRRTILELIINFFLVGKPQAAGKLRQENQ